MSSKRQKQEHTLNGSICRTYNSRQNWSKLLEAKDSAGNGEKRGAQAMLGAGVFTLWKSIKRYIRDLCLFPCGASGKELAVRSLGREDPLEEGRATHSSILVWRIPWTEEPGGLQSLWSERVGQKKVTEHAHTRYDKRQKKTLWDLPGAQWVGIHMPTQETQIWSLV